MVKNPGFIFDMDGVIVNSNPAHITAIKTFCKKYHQDFSQDFLVNHLFGRTNEEWIPEIFGDLEPEKLKKLADEKEQLFRDNFSPEDHIVPGIIRFLKQLQAQNFPMAVATSAPVENVDYILSHLSIRNYFTAILDSSYVTEGKPKPEIYVKAAKALNHKPQNCVVFEDSMAGVQAGLAAGAKVVGVMTTHSKDDLLACDLVIEDFTNLTIREVSKLF